MNIAAEHITEVLELPAIALEIGDKSFWELAEEGTTYPFVNFSINDNGPATKNGVSGYMAQLRIFAKSLTEAGRIAQVIRDEVRASSYRWNDRGARSAYTDNEAKEAFIEITFEFKV